MIRRVRRRAARIVIATVAGAAISVALVCAAAAGDHRAPAIRTTEGRAAAPQNEACGLLTPADITKAAGITVKDGTAGAPVPGTLGRCTWLGTGNTKVIVTLGDASHMQLTLTAQLQSGGSAVSGVGSKAVAVPGAGFTGGGYILTVLDAKGGFGVSVLGHEGTKDRVIALAKVVAARR